MYKCRVHGKRACIWCVLTTFSFPLEHFVWERIIPFVFITRALGL